MDSYLDLELIFGKNDILPKNDIFLRKCLNRVIFWRFSNFFEKIEKTAKIQNPDLQFCKSTNEYMSMFGFW